MNYKNFSIGNQLFLGFSAIVLAIVVLGIVAFNQGVTLHKQTENLYHHSLVVRRAVSDIETNVAKMRLATRDFMLAKNNNEAQVAILDGLKAEQVVERNFRLIFDAYTGPRQDIDNAYEAFKIWNAARQKNHSLVLEGKLEDVKHNISSEGDVGVYRGIMLQKIQVVSDFAKNKSTVFLNDSQKTADDLGVEIMVICFIIIAFTIAVAYFFVSRIRLPLKELKNVVAAYRAGNLDVRSTNNTTNEIGTVAVALNDLLDNVKIGNIISEKIGRIADAMLVEDNAHTFFRTLLPVLATETNSQIAAFYILNESKTEFYLYEAVGLCADCDQQHFSAINFQGEFGVALASKKIHFVRNIPLDTRFIFNTVSGNMVPREIVTIPILVGSEVVAMVSLASLRQYTDESINLFYKNYDVLSARIDGILAYRNIRKVALRLQQQNIELEQQRNELNQQSTELAQQNGELEIQKNQLKEASRLKTTFLSNMSHELRTPLNSVIALSGVLNRRLQNVIPEDEYSYIGIIERNGRHLLTLINDILDISRIEAGREEVDISEFDINNAIAEVVEMIQPQAVDRHIKLLQHKTKQNVLLQSDNKKVRHILQNLIANAVKFTEKGSVEISVTKADNKISIQIKDTGIGIQAEHLTHIFDEFRQADSSTSRRFGGTGLGLAIAQKYARLLGGDIMVVSEHNKGSVFTLVLPEKNGTKIQLHDIDSTFEPPVYSNYSVVIPKLIPSSESERTNNILLVEDSEPAIVQIKDMLESNNYTVWAARSGAEALQLLTQFTPDAMILDLMMPVMDGFELLEKIRNFEKTKHVPVLILTAKHITKEDIKFLKNNNIHQLIQKGDIQRDALIHAVFTMVHPFVPETQNTVRETHNTERETRNTERETQNTKREIDNAQLTVLIVEDNTDNMTTVKAVIGGKFKILEAVDGAEGVQMAQKHNPDFILMDIALPVLDGIQAFKQIRSDPRLTHIPVLALTASAMLSDRETILAHGFEAYIPKPIDENQFFEIINKVLYGK